VGEARNGNVLLNALSLAGMASVHSGNSTLLEYAPFGDTILPKMAVSPASTTSSLRSRPPHPAASAHDSHTDVAGWRGDFTMSMSGYRAAPSVFATSGSFERNVFMHLRLCGPNSALFYGCVRM
jgi:hypothetical protein